MVLDSHRQQILFLFTDVHELLDQLLEGEQQRQKESVPIKFTLGIILLVIVGTILTVIIKKLKKRPNKGRHDETPIIN